VPAVDRPGKKGVYFELPVELVAELRGLAERNGRDLRSEVEHALRRHLAAPPTVRVVVDTPDLPAAEVMAESPTPQYADDAPAIGHRKPTPKKARQPAKKKPGPVAGDE
jgi:hypothetical protein